MPSQAGIVLLLAHLLSSPGPALARDLPARFEAARVYLELNGPQGQHLRLYTDTGGGLFLRQRTVERLHLPQHPLPAGPWQRNDTSAVTTLLPDFALAAGIPPPRTEGGRLMVMPTDREPPAPPGTADDDGILGQAWFSDRIWTWDYPARKFRHEDDAWKAPADMHRLPLGFKTGKDGVRETSFPRMEVMIDGRTHSLLLDTGAMTVLTPQALAQLDDGGPAERATSMIADAVFQSWRKAHPDWRFIESAQSGTGSAMIEVPEVIVAGYRTGPVWFTHRSNRNFHDYMSSMMDAHVDGALGGNAFRHFVMTVDYAGATAYFRCVEDCRSSSD